MLIVFCSLVPLTCDIVHLSFYKFLLEKNLKLFLLFWCQVMSIGY